ncbi:MAG: PQQ-binding-like beta-propeller repeat protein, partial [Streptomycetaceae bacterium]|nr:PQQ-binding-like beta-propeller repeat protein [Streptomycetaceae bacterium]
FALDRATGELRWGRRHGHWSAYAAVPDRAGPVLFFRRYPVTVVALDPGTGESVWKGEYEPLGRQGRRLLVADGGGHALDVVDGAGGRLTRHTFASPPTDYVGAFDGIRIAMTSERVLVASGASGRPSWSAPTRLPDTAEGVTTCLVDGVVYVWDHLGAIRAFDAADGSLRWSGGSPWQGLSGRSGRRVRATVDEAVVVLTADGGHVAVLDRGDGCPLWAWVDPDSSPDARPPRVAVDHSGVYVATHDKLFAFDTPRHEPHASPGDVAAPRRRVVAMEPALRRTHRLTADPRLRRKV